MTASVECPECGFENGPSMLACDQCGKPLKGARRVRKTIRKAGDESDASAEGEWFCGKCGSANVADDSFCVGCGAAKRKRNARAKRDLATLPEDGGDERPITTEEDLHSAKAQYYRVKSVKAVDEMLRPAPARQSTVALLALVCAVGGIMSVFVIGPGAVLPEVVAIVLGHIALREIRASEGALLGGGAAFAALIIGYVCIGIAVLAVAGFVAILSLN